LSESLRFQTAVADVLRRMSEFPADAEPVLREIMQSACRLLGSEAAAVFTLQDDKAHLAATLGWPEAALAASRRLFPAAPGATRLRPLMRTGGWRRVVAVPMRREGVTIGAIALGWHARGAESQHDVGVLSTFADQAVIALESIRLVGEIRRKSAELELAGKHKSEFLASMSHELRTPLNAIIGFSEALLERMFGDLGEKQADYLSDIHTSGTHLLSLINDILDLSKIEAGRMDLELSEFSVPTTLQGTMSLMRERASRGDVALRLDCGSSVGAWVADERKFRQILLNLMSNAIKFTPAGGQVSVQAETEAGELQVAVRDTGIGIRAEDREVVFEEFRQGSGNHLAKVEGTGLGLALTRRLVELHGGSITLQSEPGHGSTFVVRLPAREMA
jgi:signal transduction histidine kinase